MQYDNKNKILKNCLKQLKSNKLYALTNVKNTISQKKKGLIISRINAL